MVRLNQAAGLENPLQSVFPQPVVAQRAPTTNDKNYPVGQQWIDQSSDQSYALSRVTSGFAVWILEGPGASDVDTLTGNSGGAISPTAGNINILGGDGLTVAGSGNTLTINRDAAGGYPVTPFVVGSSGEAGYTTIQAGLNAANAAGGGIVFVQPGIYTENLTLYDNTQIVGAVGLGDLGALIIDGVHTPPTTGSFVLRNCKLQSATDIFSSAAAGTSNIFIIDVAIDATNGYVFDLPNWTAPGGFAAFDIGEIGSTNCGWVNNTGGATVFMTNITMGAGSGNTMITSGFVELYNCVVKCPVDFQTGTNGIAAGGTVFENTVTYSNNSTLDIYNSAFITGSNQSITYNSSGNSNISCVSINSNNNPAIGGSGAGTLTLTNISFPNNSSIAGTVTAAFGSDVTGGISSEGASTFNGGTVGIGTDNATNAITIGTGTSARTVSIANSAAAHTVSIGTTHTTATTNISAGSGGVQVAGDVDLTTGSLQIEGAGQRLAVEGGAVTDFIGQATLVAGTVTIANTNIAATDKVFVQREGVAASTVLGVLDVSIIDSTSFTITALQPGTPGSIETKDVSVVNYFIVRQL